MPSWEIACRIREERRRENETGGQSYHDFSSTKLLSATITMCDSISDGKLSSMHANTIEFKMCYKSKANTSEDGYHTSKLT